MSTTEVHISSSTGWYKYCQKLFDEAGKGELTVPRPYWREQKLDVRIQPKEVWNIADQVVFGNALID